MKEIEVDLIESSPIMEESYEIIQYDYDFSPSDHENGDDHLATKELDYIIIAKDDEEEEEEDELQLNNIEQMKTTHQFYFVKFHPSFVDPYLMSKIENAKQMQDLMSNAKGLISGQIDSIKRKMRKEREAMSRYCRGDEYHQLQQISREIEQWHQQLEDKWLGLCDPHFHPEPGTEPNINIDEKIKELNIRMNHGSRKLAQERKSMRELEEMMQMRKEQHINHVENPTFGHAPKPTFGHVPKPTFGIGCWNRYDYWQYKSTIQRHVHDGYEQIQKLELRVEKVVKQYKRNIAELQEEIIPKEKKLAAVIKRLAWANQCIVVAQQQLDEQIAYCNEQITMLRKAKELAAKKDFVALEELSNKQVEEFMSQWKSNDAFRANYTRSVMLSRDVE